MLYAAVGGVSAFEDLDLPSATIREVCNEFPLCDESVPDRPDKVWFVVFGFMLWVYDVIEYRLGVVQVFLFVVV